MGKRPPGLTSRRWHDARKIAETKVGTGPVDKMIADGGVFCGLEGERYRVNLEVVVPLLGQPIPTDPGQAILEEIARSAGHIKYLESRLVEMDEVELIRNDHFIDEERSGGPGGGYSLKRRENRPEISVWWQLYERERKHFATVCSAAVRAGIEERKIRIAERQADMLEQAFIAAITELGLDPHSSRVRQVIGRQLKLAIEGDIATPKDVIDAPEREALPIKSTRATPDAPGVAPVDF